MKKKVKRIPKYNTGTINAQSLLDQTLGQGTLGTSGYTPTMGSTNANGGSSNGALGIAGGIASAISGASGVVANALDIEQGKNAAIFNVAGDVAQIIPGIGQILGPALKTVGAFAGEGGDVDQNTGEINKSSGLTRVLGFGRKDKSLYAESNRIKNAIQAKVHTENIRTDYMNNPNAPGLINLNAAEGAIVRKPVLAKVSPGELRIDPITLKYEEIPGDGGKPNDDDNVTKILGEGEIIASNAEHMKMPNGKTPADNAKTILDSNMSEQQKKKMIKKLTNWQEANKTKPQEYAMYGEGTGKGGVQKSVKKRRNSIWNRLQDKWNTEAIKDWYDNYYENVDKYEDHKIIDGRLFIKHNGDWYDTHNGGLGQKLLNNQLPKQGEGYTTARHRRVPFKQGVFDDVDATKIKKHKPTIPVEFVADNMNMTTHPEINNVWSRHKTDDNSISTKGISEVVAHPNNVNDTDNNVSARVQSKNGKNVRKKPVVAGTIKNPILPEYDRLSFAEPFQFNNQHLRYAPGNYVPIKPLDIEIEDEIVDEIGLPGTGKSKNRINWQDALYRAAVLTQPLWGREKAEPVQYAIPDRMSRPVAVSIAPTKRAIEESHAIARYNQPNMTGAGMAYGLQAAANRASQLADAYTWQTAAQNDLIGKNVDSYNAWADRYATIMNNVYDKNAANRATARNINRQNAAAALKNWGQIRRDDKLSDVQKATLNMYAPAIKAVMEDPYSVLNPLYNLNR